MENLNTKSQSEILTLSEKREAVYKLNKGDVILLTDGSEMEFDRMKRTKFSAIMDCKTYDVPVGMFVKVLCKAKVKPNIISVNFPLDIPKVQNWYKELKKDDFFYIVNGKGRNCLVFKFVEMSHNKIIGKHLVDGHRITVDLTFEGGKIK